MPTQSMSTPPGKQTPTMPATGAHPALEAVAEQNRHVRCVQAWQALADGQELDELLVVYPVVLCDQSFAQVRHHSAEAGGADDEELPENIEDGSFGAGRSYQGFFIRGSNRCFTHGFVVRFLSGGTLYRSWIKRARADLSLRLQSNVELCRLFLLFASQHPLFTGIAPKKANLPTFS